MDADGAPPGVDIDRLTTYLDTHAPGMISGPLHAELIVGGRSNLTYLIGDDAASWVLRRPPLGHVLATAHDMSREYRVMSALQDSDVPVAKTLIFCDDPDVIGAPFYIMERVEGLVLRNYDEAMAIGEAQIPALSYRLTDVLGRLHAVDPASIGLAEFGRPDGFLERQVARWSKQLDASRSRPVDGIDQLATRLRESIPVTQRAGIVHGDYRLDNCIVAPNGVGEFGVAAVVDWEMSTLGDPLTDIGLFCVYWAGMGSAELVPTAVATDAKAPFPSTRVLIDTYADASGLDLTDLPWYVAFACFKLAVIVEGIHYRYSLGKTVGEGFGEMGAMVEPLIARGLASLSTS